MTDAPLHQALAFARHGWRVFPCLPGQKVPATAHGYRDATTDPRQITEWFARHPDYNLAIATGAPGPDVLDIDQHGPARNGYEAFDRLRAAGLADGAAAWVRTPSGGMHAYFAGSDQRSGRLPRHHLDFRAQGGYVLTLSSQIGGRPYQILQNFRRRDGLDWTAATRLLEPQRQFEQPGQRSASRTKATVPVSGSRLARAVMAGAAPNRAAISASTPASAAGTASTNALPPCPRTVSASWANSAACPAVRGQHPRPVLQPGRAAARARRHSATAGRTVTRAAGPAAAPTRARHPRIATGVAHYPAAVSATRVTSLPDSSGDSRPSREPHELAFDGQKKAKLHTNRVCMTPGMLHLPTIYCTLARIRITFKEFTAGFGTRGFL